MPNLARHRLLVGSIAIFLLASATALVLLARPCLFQPCGSPRLPTGPVSYQQVSSYDEAHLFYPGSQVLFPFGGGEQKDAIEGVVNAAFAGAVLRVDAPSDTIYSWYNSWMTSHGWHSSPALRATTQLSIVGYGRGARERFTVAMDNPTTLARTVGHSIPSGAGTVYEISYMILPAS